MIKGFSLGGGLAVAMAADLRFASTDSQFGIPASRLGADMRPERGVPTILFGPGDPEVAHAADESVDLDELMTAAKFYALLGQKALG